MTAFAAGSVEETHYVANKLRGLARLASVLYNGLVVNAKYIGERASRDFIAHVPNMMETGSVAIPKGMLDAVLPSWDAAQQFRLSALAEHIDCRYLLEVHAALHKDFLKAEHHERQIFVRAASLHKYTMLPLTQFIQLELLQIGMLPGCDRFGNCEFHAMRASELMALVMITVFVDRMGGIGRYMTPMGVVNNPSSHWQCARCLSLLAADPACDHNSRIDIVRVVYQRAVQLIEDAEIGGSAGAGADGGVPEGESASIREQIRFLRSRLTDVEGRSGPSADLPATVDTLDRSNVFFLVV